MKKRPGFNPSEKILAVLTMCSVVLFMIGFYGKKISDDKAPLPDILPVRIMRSCGVGFMAAGGVLFAVCMILGVRSTNRGKLKFRYFLPYLFILPTMTGLILFTAYPLLNLVYLSLFRGSILKPTKSYKGIDNYTDLFKGLDYKAALSNTAVYTVFVVILMISVSLLIAVWFQKRRVLHTIGQSIMFTPHLIATMSIAFIWSWIMDQHSYGLLNTLLGAFGIPPVKWLESSNTALGCIIAVNVWKGIGYYCLILMSALNAIPQEIYEAAELDSASKAKVFFKITVPMLSPQLFFLLTTITIGSFKVFDSVNVMTGGGPGRSTEVLTRLIYEYVYGRSNMLGDASAVSMTLVLILSAMSVLYFKALEKRVYYQ